MDFGVEPEGEELLSPFRGAGLVAGGGEDVPVPVGMGLPHPVAVLYGVGLD